MAAAAVALLICAVSLSSQATPYDVLIRNGRVLDGSGNPWLAADLGIRGGRIVDMGRLGNAAAARVIDARGLRSRPASSTCTRTRRRVSRAASRKRVSCSRRGITTVAINPDGGGTVDLRTQRAGFEQRGVGVNVALYVPHGSIRREVLGMADRAPNAQELERMTQLARRGMEAGGIGLSSGLYYAPRQLCEHRGSHRARENRRRARRRVRKPHPRRGGLQRRRHRLPCRK
jgi:N-acyl-D-aspartate/D-glutamate deacylase